MGRDFLLHSKETLELYNTYAKDQPIIDYHCHLSPGAIAEDTQFDNLTKAWLYDDHHNLRAMCTNGIGEEFCSGNAPDTDKFLKWA